MSIKQLKNLPVSDISAENCALLMWVTLPMIKEGLDLMDAWSFEYKTTAFVWNKVYKSGNPYCGMGYWTRSGTEICILGFCGKLERKSKSVYQVISAPVTRHSEKPDISERIIKLFGDLPRIELFARKEREGWDVWGNQIPSTSIE